MKRFICNSKNPERDAYIWNTIAAMSNSFQTMLLMLVITRMGKLVDSGIFAIAYAVGNLMMSFGKYGMRNYQVTDVDDKYSYKVYMSSRIVTGALMAVFCVVYIGYGVAFLQYTPYKALCVLLICMVKWIDTMEDVMHGRLQQKGRLDIASKILGIRMLGYIILFAVLYLVLGNLLMTELICLLFSIGIAFYCNRIAICEGYVEKITFETGHYKEQTWKLLQSCFPLAAGTFLIMYLGNAPKYIIDAVVSDEVQTCFNIIFMPVFVITLLSSFVFNPILGKVAYHWANQDKKQFWKLVLRQIVIIMGITVCAVIFAYVLGVPVLSWIYQVNLDQYCIQLCILMLAGGLLAILNLFNMVITAMRKQQILLWIFGAGTLIMLVFGNKILKVGGLQELCVFYCGVLSGVGFMLLAVILYTAAKGRK